MAGKLKNLCDAAPNTNDGLWLDVAGVDPWSLRTETVVTKDPTGPDAILYFAGKLKNLFDAFPCDSLATRRPLECFVLFVVLKWFFESRHVYFALDGFATLLYQCHL